MDRMKERIISIRLISTKLFRFHVFLVRKTVYMNSYKCFLFDKCSDLNRSIDVGQPPGISTLYLKNNCLSVKLNDLDFFKRRCSWYFG